MAQASRHAEETQANLRFPHRSHDDHHQPNIPHYDATTQPPLYVDTDAGAASKDAALAGSNPSAAEQGRGSDCSNSSSTCGASSDHHAPGGDLPEDIKEKLVIHDVVPCDDIDIFEDDIHGPAFARPEHTPAVVPHDDHLHVAEDHHPECHEGVGERVEDMLPAGSPFAAADHVVEDLPESIKELVADEDDCVVPCDVVDIFEDDIHGPALASPDHISKVSLDHYLHALEDNVEECHEGAPEKVSWSGEATHPHS